jgi:hypothetical protein
MRLFDKVFNGLVDAMRWMLQVEPASASIEKSAEVHWKPKNGALSYRALKRLTRADAQERVRIVQNGRSFGAILDFHHPRYGWSPGHILRDGITYPSLEVAEAEAREAVGWMQDWKEEPSHPAEPGRP